jgi:hypothetical protein
MPILGTIDSAKTGNLVTGAFYSIQTLTGTGSSAVFDFTSIPSTYKNLFLVISGVDTSVNSDCDDAYMRFNNDATAGAYQRTNFASYQTTTSSSGGGGASSLGSILIRNGGNSGTFSNANALATIWIYNYADTNTFTGVTYQSAGPRNAGNYNYQTTGIWENTSAVNRVTITHTNGNFSTKSKAYLYGVTA